MLDNNCNFCNHEFEPLIYIYDDDWWHIGNKVFNKNNKEMRLMYCKKCGLVFVKEIKNEETN